MILGFQRLTAALLAIGWLAATPLAMAQEAKGDASAQGGESAKPKRKRNNVTLKDAAESGEAIVPGRLEFRAENGVYKAVGIFKQWQITKFDYDPADPTKGSIEVLVKLASVTAGDKDLTAHLKTKDFFEVEKFPNAIVKVDRLQKAEEADHYTATATVTIKDIAKEYPAKFKLAQTGDFLRAAGEITVKRSDYSMYTAYDPADELSPKDEVTVVFDTAVGKSLVREAPSTETKETKEPSDLDKAKKELEEAADGVSEGAGKARDAIKDFKLGGD